VGSAELADRFERFVACLTPPAASPRLRDFVCWLEDLIGPDPLDSSAAAPGFDDPGEAAGAPPPPFSLEMVACIRGGDTGLQERDIAALRCFKDVLRGLVWAEEAVAGARGRVHADSSLDYRRFLAELVGAVAATTFEPPAARADAILFADPHTARGVPYTAAAILSLAEGELPRRRSEDPFLRNADRRRLRAAGLPLEDSTRSFEREAFYAAVARGRDGLLLCRPRLAENGAPWEASPYWHEVERLLGRRETIVPGEHRPPLDEVASLPELAESALRHAPAASWLQLHAPAVLAQLRHGAGVAAVRAVRRVHRPPTPFDGFLGDDAAARRSAAPRLRRWSPTALERYRACPYWYYLSYVLRLEQRPEPEEGANFAQTGNLYHRILEQVYRQAADPTDLAELLALLPAVAQSVFDAAPRQEGFRVTAWWAQTKAEIEANVAASLAALAEYDGTPFAFELSFHGDGALHLNLGGEEGEAAYSVSGKIDRVDRRPDGSLRIIDYKTGVGDYDSARTLIDGRRLQLALYALAAQSALELGEVSDGFYWFAHKTRGSWTLATFEDPATGATGAQAAIEIALHHASAAVGSARQGKFAPQPPTGGCPEYCTAANFCWHFRPKYTP
jgi:RecB family exonuclease